MHHLSALQTSPMLPTLPALQALPTLQTLSTLTNITSIIDIYTTNITRIAYITSTSPIIYSPAVPTLQQRYSVVLLCNAGA